jgi:PPOX class probable F420-dependent enzyme
LVAGVRVGTAGSHRKLAVVAASGAPLVAPVWVALDGDDILFNTGATTAKGRAIRRDPRVAMCFDDEQPPFSFVLVHGTASISEDLDEVRLWAGRIGRRYMGGPSRGVRRPQPSAW